MIYAEIVARRRAFRLDGYKSLADVDFDGPWVTPYQISACSPDGPVLVAYNWLDAPSVDAHRDTLKMLGYLPSIMFNKVLDRALEAENLTRREIYITQAFHLLPTTRSSAIKSHDIDASFGAITRHELVGRHVIALGDAAARACDKHGIKSVQVCHPSARGMDYDTKAEVIAKALRQSI